MTPTRRTGASGTPALARGDGAPEPLGPAATGQTGMTQTGMTLGTIMGRWVGETYRRRPMIVPNVIPV